jgi:Uma2 family endonuclease
MTTLLRNAVNQNEVVYPYESIGVTEYWQFDPRGEWIPEKLRGYRLRPLGIDPETL